MNVLPLKKETSVMNIFSSSGKAEPRPVTKLVGNNESFQYAGGAINVSLRLSPQRQDAFEQRLTTLNVERDAKAAAAAAAYDTALKDAEAARAAALNEATVTYERTLRDLFVEFNQPEPPVEKVAA